MFCSLADAGFLGRLSPCWGNNRGEGITAMYGAAITTDGSLLPRKKRPAHRKAWPNGVKRNSLPRINYR